jgi:integrase
MADFMYRGRRIRKRAPIQTRRGAEELERVLKNTFLEDDAAGRDPFAGPPPAFAEFSERWMREYVEPNNRLSSRRSKAIALRVHLIPFFGRLRLDQITVAQIDAFKAAKHRAGLNPKTVNNILSMLRCSLTTAHEWGLLRQPPKVRWLRVPVQGYRYMSTDEAKALVPAAPAGFWRTLILFLLHTGCRFGEAAGLMWQDLDLDAAAPVVHIKRAASLGIVGPTKTGRPRDIPLSEELVAALRTFRRDGARVFQRSDGGIPNPESTLKYLHRFCDRAGIERVSWHVLRHTFATELVARGVPLPVVQRLLGHTTIMMTSRYTHVAPSTLSSAVALLPRLGATQSEPFCQLIVSRGGNPPVKRLLLPEPALHNRRTEPKADPVGSAFSWSG